MYNYAPRRARAYRGMDLGTALRDAIIVLVLASLPSVAWFFKMRRVMLQRQASLIRALEEEVKPRDKRYWLAGYLVGFTAKYWMGKDGIDKVWVTYTTPPYHAFFYLPIIALFKKRERLDIRVDLTRKPELGGEAHVYRRNVFVVRKNVELDIKESKRKLKKKLAGKGIEVYTETEDALSKALDLWSKLEKHGTVHRVSVDSHLKRVTVSLSPNGLNSALEAVRTVIAYASKSVKKAEASH